MLGTNAQAHALLKRAEKKKRKEKSEVAERG
jgi:hypothetical protein